MPHAYLSNSPRNLKAFGIAILLFVCAITNFSHAKATQAETHTASLTTKLSFLADPSSALSFDQITALPESRFETVPASHTNNVLNFGFSRDTYWVKLVLQRTPEAPDEWMIEIPYQGLDEIDFFAPGKPPVLTGAARSIESRALFNRYFVFPVEVMTTPQTFYVRVRSSYSVTVPINVIERQSFIQSTQKSLIVQFLYFGGILTLILYNLQLYISLRDKSYLLYSLFGLATGLGIFSGNGFGRILLWPEAPAWDQISQSVLLSLGGAFSVLFARSFLKTKRYLARLDRWIWFLAVSYTITAFGLLSTLYFPGIQGFWYQALMLLTVPYFLLITTASIKIWRSGHVSAEYYLLAWGFLCTGVIIATLRTFDWLPSNIVTGYAIQIGTGLEMLSLSYALAYRIRSERAKRDIAQEEALEAKHLLVESLQASEEHLEQLVKERTSQLTTTLASEKHLREQYVRFSALISHEFRNPLNNIQSQTDLLQREHSVGIDHLKKRTTVIFSAVQQLSFLFDRWVQSDRINNALALENVTTISVNEWLQGLVERFKSSHLNHSFNIATSTTPISLAVDETLLQVAVINLLDNACKYSPENSQIDVGIVVQDHEIGIEIADSGEGIHPQYHQAIFEEAFRITPNHPKHGAGLGLAFVKRIIDLHHGRVTVCSQLGAGATFTLWLPR